MKAPIQKWEIVFRTHGITSVVVEGVTEADARSAAWLAFEEEPRDAEWEIDTCSMEEACPLSGEPLEECRMCMGEHCEAHPDAPCECDSEQRHLTHDERRAS